MGLFSRKEPSASGGRRSSARTSSEAQAAELRIRARRRLIGALVLVLTAVIFVPMLFDSPPDEELATPVVLPEPIPPMPAEPQVALAPEQVPPPVDSGVIEEPPAPPEVLSATPAPAETAANEPAAETRKPEPPAKPQATEAPKPASSQPAASGNNGRTDDGSLALALLEGRQPEAAPRGQAAGGNFVLQVAAYTTRSDAQSRREKLVAAGVTNAYVEEAVANGKTAYRLRVGPFPSRDAADAAQARLRQLGYNNGLIFTK